MSALSIITHFIHKIDSSIQIDFDSDFCADVVNKIVYIESKEHLEEDRLIQNFVQDNFNVLMDPFLIGILHEVGHIMTYDEQKNGERAVLYALLAITYDKSKYEEYSNAYFSIPAEFEATKWAVNYYVNHQKLCDNFLKELYSE